EESEKEDSEEEEYEEEEENSEEEVEPTIKVRTPSDATASSEKPNGEAASAAVDSTNPAVPSTASKLASGLKAALGITNRRQQPQPQPGAAAPPPKTERQAVIEQLEAADQ